MVVQNVDKLGTVVVSGDTFIAEEDLQSPMMWRPLAWQESIQEESRRRLLCFADYMVPGHGRLFKVTPAMRSRVACTENDHLFPPN